MIPMITRLRFSNFWFPVRICKQTHVALTGLQPTGIPHLGNYLGAIKPCMELRDSGKLSQLFLIIADLHALTSNNNGLALSQAILDLASTLVACLFKGEKSPLNTCQQSLFLQSSVIGHTELAWVLASTCSLPRLSHLPQWRDKSGFYDQVNTEGPEKVTAALIPNADPFLKASVGLFTYPILQAADIMLYGSDLVPVGVDQTTHIELARYLVGAATRRWPDLESCLRIPTGLITNTPKINSLRDPTKKMSKSDPSLGGAIFLSDSPDTIRSKVRRAQTDSIRSIYYDVEHRPGVSNLLRILAAMENRSMDEVISLVSGWNKETLKSRVVDVLVQELGPIRVRIENLRTTPEGRSQIDSYLSDGSLVANRIAQTRLTQIYSAIGLKLPNSSLTTLPMFNHSCLDSNFTVAKS
ncbi:tryptophanyl-tRNA synthetase [Paragonimus westermani]|uniref:tryptophan--tRNA ligase n=1 Tax=Paragonimus westermani TaxID=34504 RepID=A0A5J4NLC6_9TREM|nr:tryptophanyl-tRNA synthetase [Paragonimus westermani]